jgi:hypothetical protein
MRGEAPAISAYGTAITSPGRGTPTHPARDFPVAAWGKPPKHSTYPEKEHNHAQHPAPALD